MVVQECRSHSAGAGSLWALRFALTATSAEKALQYAAKLLVVITTMHYERNS
jgi:hypothetical protein